MLLVIQLLDHHSNSRSFRGGRIDWIQFFGDGLVPLSLMSGGEVCRKHQVVLITDGSWLALGFVEMLVGHLVVVSGCSGLIVMLPVLLLEGDGTLLARWNQLSLLLNVHLIVLLSPTRHLQTSLAQLPLSSLIPDTC